MATTILESPSYQPAAEYAAWRELNNRALIRRWWECTTALMQAGEKLGVQADDVEFEGFCRSQFDLAAVRS